MKTKILYITPHLSTGGLPQYLYKQLALLNSEYDLYCVEWENITGGKLVVQRKLITSLLKDKFHTLGSNKNEIHNLIFIINPDIIHFCEFPETFIPYDICEKIYSNKTYKICETTHGTQFNPSDKKFIADKTMFVSSGNYMQYKTVTADADVIEYPTESMDLRNSLLKQLGLDESKFHILNVGLFTENKNQAEIFEYAKQFDKSVMFHFVGNQADNFKKYWEPLIKNMPKNCRVWGERDDVFKFYAAMDLFLFTSKLENRPLVVREALNNNMKILMYNLPNYADEYLNENIAFLASDISANIDLIKSYLPDYKKPKSAIIQLHTYNKIKACHLLTDVFAEREMRSIQTLSKLADYNIDYEMYINKPYTDLPPKETCAFPDIVDNKPGGKLTGRHYGCYLAHRDAILQSIEENTHEYLLVFEADCGITVDMDTFVKKINKACEILDANKDIVMFYLVHHHDEHILEKLPDYYIVEYVIGAHAYIIPKRAFKIIKDVYKLPWNVTDLFYGNNLRNYKVASFPELLTKQFSGVSLLEETFYDDKY